MANWSAKQAFASSKADEMKNHFTLNQAVSARSNFPDGLRYLLVLLTAFFCWYSLSAQFSGGYEAGQATPKKAEKAKMGGGAIAGQVNTFNGTLNLSYNFGTVSTLSGLSFPVVLSYNSTGLTAYDHPQNSGIPYGEGWNLAEGYISVDNFAWDHDPGELPNHPILSTPGSNVPQYKKRDVSKSGQVYWANPFLSLPGGVSGRLVYKRPLESDTSKHVFVLESFSSYVEAIFDGDVWEVHTSDGTIYSFGLKKYSYRNPNRHTAQLDSTLGEQLLPGVQVDKWMLGEIRNPNHPNGQFIRFEYEKFGKEELFQELTQPLIKQLLDTINGFTIDTIDAFDQGIYEQLGYCDPCVIGNTLRFYNKPTQVTIYKDLILSRVLASDVEGIIHSEVDLKYKSFRPEGLSALKKQRGKFLLLSDPGTIRLDSLYSRQTVWFNGTDQLVSQHDRPQISSPAPFGSGWKRYMHPAAHQNPLSAYATAIDPANPFAAKYSGLVNSGVNPGITYLATLPAVTTAQGYDWKLGFLHSVLESPRISGPDLEKMPSGDQYEIRTTIKGIAGKDANFDVSLVSGMKSGMLPNPNFGGIEFQPHQTIGGVFPGFDPKGYRIFSTLSNLVKWSHTNFGAAVQLFQTRSSFRLPNLPNEFQGFHIQVGPGSDNLNYHAAQKSDLGYPTYYNNKKGVNFYNDYNFHRGRWFGTGAPLQPYFQKDYFGTKSTNSITKGANGLRHLYWHYPLANPFTNTTYTGTDVNSFGPNQPTALTIESVGTVNQNTFFPSQQSLAGAHTWQDTELMNVELIRVSKNPWMLDSVIFYRHKERVGGENMRVSAFKISYEVEQVRVLNNFDPTTNLPQTQSADTWKKVNGNYQYRNLFQLSKIERIGVDSLGKVMPAVNYPTTLITYYPEDLSRPWMQEAYLVKELYNELGGKTTYHYDFSLADTFLTNATSPLSGWDQSYDFMGASRVKTQWVVVDKVVKDDGTTQGQLTEYQFQNPMQMFSGPTWLESHFVGNGMNGLGTQFWRKGFELSKVLQPSISGSGQAMTVFTHRSALQNHADSLLFGRPIKVESFDEQGRLISRQESEFTVSVAYLNGWEYVRDYKTRKAGTLNSPAGAIASMDYHYRIDSKDARFYNSYFVRPLQQTNLTRDPDNGNFLSDTTRFTYYDWNPAGFTDPDGDYALLYNDTGNNFFTQNGSKPYFDQSSQTFNYIPEPSWQMASKRTTFSEFPSAFNETRMVYLWDIEPLLNLNGQHTTNSYPLRFDGSFRPLHLAKRYGIRNVPVEERVIRSDGSEIHEQSQYMTYKVFEDVQADFFRDIDSTNYGKSCPGNGGGLGGGVIIDPAKLKLTLVVFGTGTPVTVERMSSEVMDDPRYVQDTAGTWYFFPVDQLDTVSLATYDQMKAFEANLAGKTGGGYVQGLDSKVKYWGSFSLKNGGTVTATALQPVYRNYGKESLEQNLTEYSQKKLAVTGCRHEHYHDGCGLCYLAWGCPSTTNAPAIPNPGDTTGGGGSPERQIWIDMLDQQFFLHEVYTQADSVRNIRALEVNRGGTLHHVWETQNVTSGKWSNPIRWQFSSQFPVIRTYKVHQRNMYGQVIDESDIRGLHSVYEYAKGVWKQQWDNCGKPISETRWADFGLPLSVTQTDFQGIELTSIFVYFQDGQLKKMFGPNGDSTEFVYDGFGRMKKGYFNGFLSETNSYSLWDGSPTNFSALTTQNLVHSQTFDGIHTSGVHGRAYLDPLGRAVQSIEAVETSPGSWQKHFSPKVEFDKWNRVVRGYRPYAKNNQSGPGFDPVIPNSLFSEAVYENDARNRELKTAKTGNSISGPQVREMGYSIISLWDMIQETGITASELKEIYPWLNATTSIGNGNSQKPKFNQLYLSGFQLQRKVSTDEDGKRVISYADQLGRGIATLGYESTAYTNADRVLTLFAPHLTGGTRTVIHPNKLQTYRKYNFLGMAYEVISPDKGREKYKFLPEGSVCMYQDENLKAKAEFLLSEYDKLGRVYRIKRGKATTSTTASLLQRSPLHYQDVPGKPFCSIHTMQDFPHLKTEDFNCSGLYDEFGVQEEFSCQKFLPVQEWTEKEFRYDYPQDSGLVAYFGVNVPDDHLLPEIQHLVTKDQTYTKGREAIVLGYDPQGRPSSYTYHSYDFDGNLKWTVRQHTKGHFTKKNQGETHVIYYPEYDRQGKLLTRNLDLKANGVLDFQQHFSYDQFGRLSEVYAGQLDLKSGGTKIADYTYHEATGQIRRVRHFARDNCDSLWAVDSLFYQYDQQDRFSDLRSVLFDFDLFYDGQNPNVPPPGLPVSLASYQSGYQSNYNGNINGWRANYKLGSHGVQGFDRPTVYGFKYDGLNRLTHADASVLENLQPVNGPQFPSGNNWGTKINQTNPAWMGDVQYRYDKAGNLTHLRRYHYFGPSSPNVFLTGDNWLYEYEPGTNKLSKLKTQGLATINFSYDDNGNLLSDSKKGLNSFSYNSSNLPTQYQKGSRPVSYKYDGTDQRIYKEVTEANGTTSEVFYLRDGGGQVLAILDSKSAEWTFEIYGAGLIGEWQLADSLLADSSTVKSSPKSGILSPEKGRKTNKGKRLVKWLSKGLITCLPLLVHSQAHQQEQPNLANEASIAAVPVLWALSDAAIEGLWKDKIDAGQAPLAKSALGQDSTADSTISGIKFFVKDHLSNVRVSYVPAFGYDPVTRKCTLDYAIKGAMDYFPYGKHLRSWFDGTAERWQTTMNERDGESGLDWRGARMYDGEYGRFLSVDPLSEEFPTSTPYSYTFGRPTMLSDRSGMCPDCPEWWGFKEKFEHGFRQSWSGRADAAVSRYTPPPELAEGIASMTPVTSAANLYMIATTGKDVFGHNATGVDVASNAADFIPGEKLAKTGLEAMVFFLRYSDEALDVAKNAKKVTRIAEATIETTKDGAGGIFKYTNGRATEFLANKKIIGDRIELTDIAFYDTNAIKNEMKNKFGRSAMLGAFKAFKDFAKSKGFKEIRLQFQRAPNSSSGNPGHIFDETFKID